MDFLKREIRKMPIGIFDSGVGGLTVVKEMLRHLPGEDIIYLGDTARYPYGPRSPEIVRRFALQNARFLMGFGIKLLIVACNTASSVAMDVLKKWISVPIIGVIEPGAKAAVKTTKNRKVGVIGTQGTISSMSYNRAIKKIDESIKVFGKSCPLFVPLAEEGFLDGDVAEKIAEKYLNEIVGNGIDTLVLGCTHYPLLKKTITKVIGDDIEIIDSASSVVANVKDFLVRYDLMSDNDRGKIRFFVTDSPERFMSVGEK
ncbi:glutamate racemase, partial [bacterium]|nr:glutamate racemase [bacterium]